MSGFLYGLNDYRTQVLSKFVELVIGDCFINDTLRSVTLVEEQHPKVVLDGLVYILPIVLIGHILIGQSLQSLYMHCICRKWRGGILTYGDAGPTSGKIYLC